MGITLEKLVTQYLEAQPKARERRLRSRAIFRILQQKYPNLEAITIDNCMDFLPEAESINRMVRKVQAEREDLRGKDYDENGSKQMLEENYQLAIGYEPNYYRDTHPVRG